MTVLSEGSRGSLAQAYVESEKIGSENPQIFALGVKEIWETKKPLDSIIHTLGWPLPKDAFGGSFMYPLTPTLVALGIVVGLDYRQTTLDVHELLQRLKTAPLFRDYLEGGEMVEWGAKTIPEGGYYALPKRPFGNGVVIVGDAAGFVEVSSLKGVHYAMQSGIFAARAIFDALKKDDTSAEALSSYSALVDSSYIVSDLKARRNMRLAFQHGGVYGGGIKASLMSLSGGKLFGGKIESHTDASVPREVTDDTPFVPDGKLTFDKLSSVFASGNRTRDDQPNHIRIARRVPRDVADMWVNLCPAQVYEIGTEGGDGTVTVEVAPSNCVQCGAITAKGGRLTPPEGGSGPEYTVT